VHDELDGDVGETKIMKASAKEVLVDVVKSFFHIKFESYKTLLPFRSPISMVILKMFLQSQTHAKK